LLLVAFLLVNAPNCHLLLMLASVVQGDAVNCNMCSSLQPILALTNNPITDFANIQNYLRAMLCCSLSANKIA